MRHHPLPSLLGLAVAAALPLTAAIEIDNFDSVINDRFEDSDNPEQFLLDGFDLSGVGQDSNGRWATLIGPNTILSANHFTPSGTLTFYPGNDSTATPWQADLTTDTLRINDENGNGTDLWIARINAVAPSVIQQMDFATQNIDLGPSSGATAYFEGDSTWMTGRSPSSFGSNTDQAYGTNIISDYSEDQSANGLGQNSLDLIELSYEQGNTAYEAFLQPGDSGAPLLWDVDGTLQVLGVNSGINTENKISFINYIGNESDTIQTQIDAWAAVPEPGMAALPAGMAAVILLLWQRRRRD